MNELGNNHIRQKEIEYYTRYYRDDCSLEKYEKQVSHRLNRPENEVKRLKKLQQISGVAFTNQKHYITGVGTGERAMVLHGSYNCEVYGGEPYQPGLEIVHLKCEEKGIPKERFNLDPAENIQHEDNKFDFVHCITVLEHVENVEKSIDEMIRITKPGGRIHIDTPNYAYPREGHYKILFPTFLPKIFGYLYLRMLGKSHEFLKTINFITERDINRILVRKEGIVWQRAYEPLTRNRGRLRLLLNWLRFKRFVYPNQDVIITKLSHE